MINPIREKYQCAKSLNAWAGRITIASSILELLAFILSKLDYSSFSCAITGLDCMCGTTIIFIALLSASCTIVHLGSESERRKMAIDNAYEKSFACGKSVKYYNNDDTKKGLQRLAYNTFESCFFTNAIANIMLKRTRIKAWLLILPFLAAIFMRELNFFMQMCSLGIVTMILSEWLRLEILGYRTRNILQNFRTHYSTKSKKDKTSNNSILQMMVLDYETALSWSHILLSENIYERDNASLSKKWEEIKSIYNI